MFPPTDMYKRTATKTHTTTGTHTYLSPPIIGWQSRRLERHSCLEGEGVIDWWSFGAQGMQSCNQFVLIDCPRWETAEALPPCVQANLARIQMFCRGFWFGLARSLKFTRGDACDRACVESLVSSYSRRFATIPHYLAFIVIITFEKLIPPHCNCITWLMIQSPWNLNKASTWVCIVNEFFSCSDHAHSSLHTSD